MALVKLRPRAQITLPAEVRRALEVEEGDYLETEITDGGVLIRAAGAADRLAARARRQTLSGGSRWLGPGPEPSEDEVMEMVVEEIEDMRREDREGRRR